MWCQKVCKCLAHTTEQIEVHYYKFCYVQCEQDDILQTSVHPIIALSSASLSNMRFNDN